MKKANQLLFIYLFNCYYGTPTFYVHFICVLYTGAVRFYCSEGQYAIKSAFYFILEYIFKIIVVPTRSPIFTNLINPFINHLNV